MNVLLYVGYFECCLSSVVKVVLGDGSSISCLPFGRRAYNPNAIIRERRVDVGVFITVMEVPVVA